MSVFFWQVACHGSIDWREEKCGLVFRVDKKEKIEQKLKKTNKKQTNKTRNTKSNNNNNNNKKRQGIKRTRQETAGITGFN